MVEVPSIRFECHDRPPPYNRLALPASHPCGSARDRLGRNRKKIAARTAVQRRETMGGAVQPPGGLKKEKVGNVLRRRPALASQQCLVKRRRQVGTGTLLT